MHYIFNYSWLECASVVIVTLYDMLGVPVSLGVRGEVTVHVVRWDGIGCGWGGAGQEVGHVMHSTNPYPS